MRVEFVRAAAPRNLLWGGKLAVLPREGDVAFIPGGLAGRVMRTLWILPESGDPDEVLVQVELAGPWKTEEPETYHR